MFRPIPSVSAAAATSWSRLLGWVEVPIDASSGKQERHRLNRGGDRQANSALWTIAICRMAADQTTRGYINRRISEGLTKKEPIRCLKRHIASEVYHRLPRPAQ